MEELAQAGIGAFWPIEHRSGGGAGPYGHSTKEVAWVKSSARPCASVEQNN